MKKFIALLMAAVLVFAFAGCTKAPVDEETSTNEALEDASVAASDLEYIKNKGTLVVGVTEFAPLDYKENDEWVGFEVDFANAVAEKLGVKVEIQLISWGSKEIELAGKSIDCIWNGLTITAERQESMSISDPYMKNKQVLVVKSDKLDEIADADSLKGYTVVAEQESAGEEVITDSEYFADATYTAVDSQKTALMEVSAGTADACVVDYVCALGMTGEGTDYTNLVIKDDIVDVDEYYGIAFRKGSDVTAEVNKIIDGLIADGSLKTIADKYNLGSQLITE